MKHVTLEEDKHLIVRGYAQGTTTAPFAIISFILFILRFGTVLGYIFLGSGIILTLVAIAMYIPNSKKTYMEIQGDFLFVYPSGAVDIGYEIPLSRIAYFTHVSKQKSANNRVLAIILNQEDDPCLWINKDLEEELEKYEVDLDFFPIKDKSLVEFFQLLGENYNIVYRP